MIRKPLHSDPELLKEFRQNGFNFYASSDGYWEQNAYYQFSSFEILEIKKSTEEILRLCLEAVDRIIAEDLFHLFSIPEYLRSLIADSWHNQDATLYGRFDFSFSKGQVKLLEFNADTPTTLLEAGLAQKLWQKRYFANNRQFSDIAQNLMGIFHQMKNAGVDSMHFCCQSGSIEDLENVKYFQSIAEAAGIQSRFEFIELIIYDSQSAGFYDSTGNPINVLYKLYPWEWLIEDPFAQSLLNSDVKIFEPIWKMLLSNKAILAVLWKMFPNHPNLLACYFESDRFSDSYVKKPLLSREGQNVSIVTKDSKYESEGIYGKEGYVYQAYSELSVFDGRYPVIGSWVIGDKSSGIGIREDFSVITSNTSRFVPHIIVDS